MPLERGRYQRPTTTAIAWIVHRKETMNLRHSERMSAIH
jgi:hypothetical protein